MSRVIAEWVSWAQTFCTILAQCRPDHIAWIALEGHYQKCMEMKRKQIYSEIIFSFSGTPPMVDLLVPPPEDTGPGKLTVGKVYGGMLILENWKLSRFGQGFNTNKGLPVSLVTPELSFFTPLLNLFS